MHRVSVRANINRSLVEIFISMPLQLSEKKFPTLNVGAVMQNPDKGSGYSTDAPINRDASETLCVDGSGYRFVLFSTLIRYQLKSSLLGRLSKLTTKIL